jgi:hypothetical protein
MGDGARFCPHCGGQQDEATPPHPTLRPVQPPTPARPEVAQPAKAGKGGSHQKRNGVIVGAVLLLIIIAVSSSGSSNSPSTTIASGKKDVPKTEQYIRSHGADANRVQANVVLVSLAINKAKKTGNLYTIAQAAQEAHDNLDNIRNNFAGTPDISCSSCDLGDASLELFAAANDLKNAMGALVAYTGDPSPATLAQYNAQFRKAQSEWNQGVRFIWAGKRNKPVI